MEEEVQDISSLDWMGGGHSNHAHGFHSLLFSSSLCTDMLLIAQNIDIGILSCSTV